MSMIKSDSLIFEYIQHEEGTKHTALNGVDVNINEGELVAILGHNGSGKSTLAKHMNALLIPTQGTVWVKGYDTKEEDHIWDIRQNAGMVFQNPDNQIVATIVEEDVAFGPENMGIPPKEIRQRVDNALSAVGMQDYKRHAPHHLSGGQKQRIAIAGILAMKPSCIILDEPTAMLDPLGRKEVIDTVIKLNREEGITVILITHYMEEAVKADRVIVMDSGNIVMDNTPSNVFKEVETLKKYHLDVPQVTEVAYLLRKNGLDIPDDILNIDEMVDTICKVKIG